MAEHMESHHREVSLQAMSFLISGLEADHDVISPCWLSGSPLIAICLRGSATPDAVFGQSRGWNEMFLP